METGERHQETIPPSLLATLMATLERVPADPGYTPDRGRQQRVLACLPADTLQELAAHRFASDYEQRFHEERLGLPHTEQEETMVMRGKVFELLVAADPQLYTPSPIAEELLALLHDPDRFDLADALGYPRNPDLAFLVVEKLGGAVTIKAAGECKLGRLNSRALKQLDEGFLRGLQKAADVVSARRDLKEHGLLLIKDTTLGIAADFRLILVVPANRDTKNLRQLIKTEELSPEEQERLLTLLADPARLIIQKAAFSASEVALLTNVLTDTLDNA